MVVNSNRRTKYIRQISNHFFCAPTLDKAVARLTEFVAMTDELGLDAVRVIS